CIGLNHDHRVAAGGVLDLDAVEQIGSAASGDELAQSVLRNRTRPLLAWSAYENALHGIARYLAGHTAHLGDNGAGETPSLPPGGDIDRSHAWRPRSHRPRSCRAGCPRQATARDELRPQRGSQLASGMGDSRQAYFQLSVSFVPSGVSEV